MRSKGGPRGRVSPGADWESYKRRGRKASSGRGSSVDLDRAVENRKAKGGWTSSKPGKGWKPEVNGGCSPSFSVLPSCETLKARKWLCQRRAFWALPERRTIWGASSVPFPPAQHSPRGARDARISCCPLELTPGNPSIRRKG